MGEESYIYGIASNHRIERAFQDFVNAVLKDGKPRGKIFQLSNLPFPIFQKLRQRGIRIVSDHVCMSDKTVLKYLNHPKESKGAVLPHKEFWKIANIAKMPRNIYIDSKRKNVVIALTSRHKKNKLIKVIVEPNYRYGKRKVNMITSIGVIEKSRMKHPQYIKIK